MVFSKKKILVVVKTYPNPSKTYQETVCVAGILLEDPSSWIRLYPVPFRDLPFDQQFNKYQIIEAEVAKNPSDTRPESFKIKADTIKTLGEISSSENWREKKEYLLPLEDPSMCEIQRQREIKGQSLGIFKPRAINDFLVEPSAKDWDQGQKEILSQMNIFKRNKKILERIPFEFKIQYTCSDPDCHEHKQGIIDWETAQLY